MREFRELAKLLREARVKKGLLQQELGDKLGVLNYYVSSWERGLCGPPDHCFQKLISVLELNREELVEAMMEDAKQDIIAKVFKRQTKRAS